MTSTPFPAGGRDPLLLAARIVAIFMMVLMGIVVGALVFAVPVVLFNQTTIIAELAKEGYTGVGPQAVGAIVAMIVLAIIPAALIFAFLRVLNMIIDTVSAGEPFAPENATRLARMGWIVLAVQLVAVPLGALGYWLAQRIPDADVDVDFGFSGSGLVLALVLFILSRVFRHGTAMREELEGTV